MFDERKYSMMDDTLTEHFNKTIQSTTVKQRSKKLPAECKICGAPALYSYFGAVVCPSCKIFFRRNARIKQGHFKCVFNGQCQINIHNRYLCTSCRLAKCFASGMQIEMIRAPRTATNNTNQKTSVTIISTVLAIRGENNQPQQLLTSNLLQSDQSTLSIDEWNLLSNLTDCYDEYRGFSLAQHFLQEQNELPPKMRFKLTPVARLLTLITSVGQLVYEKNLDFISLCSHDRSILLHKTMKYVSGLGTCFIMHHTRLLDDPGLYKSAELIYGTTTVANITRAIDQLNFDGTFFKLVLAILSFSTFDYIYYTNKAPVNLLNIKAVLVIQDVYTKLIWRYLLYKYDHERAVICFLKLLRCLFLVNNAIIEAIECRQYTDMISSLIKQTEETFSLTG